MKQLFIAALYSLLVFFASAQDKLPVKENPSAYFNNFQKYIYTDPDADSAFYFVKKLASNERFKYILSDLIHNSFVQDFLQNKSTDPDKAEKIKKQQLLSDRVLTKIIADTTMLLQQTTRPMYLWKMVQDNKENMVSMYYLVSEFMKTEMSSGDIYTNRRGRYGLMIYKVISEYPELKPLAESLFVKIYADLENNQLIATDSLSRIELDKRAWYRYLYAYANYVRAEQEVNKEPFLKKAFDYSPDLTDRDHYSAYFYDMVALFGNEEKPTFKPDYLSLLTNTSTDRSLVLPVLLKTALTEPEYKNTLKEFYNTDNVAGQNFDKYWRNAINTTAKPAPSISLALLDRKTFSTKRYSGKWILVDFWGTWCAPCRAEHPEMQQFYDSLVLKNPKNISFLTIACKDTKEKVLAYLSEKHFTFPVAMADNKIENIYQVQGYPTKILITPEGKYLTIPFGIDWVSFVKQYCNLK